MAGSSMKTGSTSMADVRRHAARLADAYNSGAVAPIRTDLESATIDDAYAIQSVNTDRWVGDGRIVVGAKTGLTSKAVQQQLGVNQPDFGILFADMAIEDGATIERGRLLQPKVEAEVAFVMRREPNIERLTTAELISSIDYVLPVLEIVDSRILGWDIGIIDTIADNASSGLFALGTRPVSVGELDLRLCGMVLEKNGEPVSFGAGAACLGHPLHALGWLARTLAKVGRPLEQGSIVLSGALGPMIAVQAGDAFEGRIEGVGTVRVRFGK